LQKNKKQKKTSHACKDLFFPGMAAADLEKKIYSAKHALKYIFPEQIPSPVHVHQPPLLTHQSQQISPLPNPNTTAAPSTSPRHHSLCPDQPTTVSNHTEDKSLKLDNQLQTTATPTQYSNEPWQPDKPNQTLDQRHAPVTGGPHRSQSRQLHMGLQIYISLFVTRQTAHVLLQAD
jgi:hypothetical protein